MKSKLLLIKLLFLVNLLSAQDSLRLDTVFETFKKPIYEPVFDDVYHNKKSSKWLLKFDFINALGAVFENDNNTRPIGIEFERKIVPQMSLNFSVASQVNFYSLNDNDTRTIRYSLEPRWFLGMKQRITEGVQADNLNGQYVSLTGSYYQNIAQNNAHSYFLYLVRGKPNTLLYSLSANYGIQKRVFNRWYINYKIGVGGVVNGVNGEQINGVNYVYLQSQNRWNWFVDNQFTLGLAFGGGKKTAVDRCHFFNCFIEEKHVLKVDLKGLLGERLQNQYKFRLGLAHEDKILNSSFSINSSFNTHFKRQTMNGFLNSDNRVGGFSDHFRSGLGGFSSSSTSKIYNYGFELGVEPRWYFTLKKRIAKGKSANNLSGLYTSIETRYQWARYDFINIKIKDKLDTQFTQNAFTASVKLGMQKRIFRNGYFDFNISPFKIGHSIIKGDKGTQGTYEFNGELGFIGLNFGLGLAF